MASFENVFKATNVKKPEVHPRRETKWIHYTKLVGNKKQYRNNTEQEKIEALAALIEAEKGVVQNLLVRKYDTDEYEIIAGHHRHLACQYLVEVKGLKEYEFLPCTVETLNDVRAEFQLYSSNGFVPKTDYEIMYELERMKYLLENYPEEFPHLQTGRMVERLATQLNMKKSTVGEYLTIANNLGEKGMDAFREGRLKKSAAVELSSLPEPEQEQLIDQGVTAHKDIKAYKEKEETVPNFDTEEPEEENVPNFGTQQPDQEDVPLPGQLRIINTKMDISEEEAVKEDVPNFGTQRTETAGMPLLKNNEERKAWLWNYKDWGVWYEDENIGAVYYKYDFPDGTRLIAETYKHGYSYAFFHLVGGPKKRPIDQHGIPKYPYHEHYSKHPDSETELVEFLKAIQK